MDAFSGLPDWFITTVLAIGAFALFWLNRQRLGLGEVQMASKAEQLQVIALQERRIELLEAEVQRLKAEVQYLSAENHEYRRRITRLESHDRTEAGGE